jgi:hypothetical protein
LPADGEGENAMAAEAPSRRNGELPVRTYVVVGIVSDDAPDDLKRMEL